MAVIEATADGAVWVRVVIIKAMADGAVWVGAARPGPIHDAYAWGGVLGLGGSSPGAAAYKDGRKKSGGGREVSEDDK